MISFSVRHWVIQSFRTLGTMATNDSEGDYWVKAISALFRGGLALVMGGQQDLGSWRSLLPDTLWDLRCGERHVEEEISTWMTNKDKIAGSRRDVVRPARLQTSTATGWIF